jgi:hypothetical protein
VEVVEGEASVTVGAGRVAVEVGAAVASSVDVAVGEPSSDGGADPVGWGCAVPVCVAPSVAGSGVGVGSCCGAGDGVEVAAGVGEASGVSVPADGTAGVSPGGEVGGDPLGAGDADVPGAAVGSSSGGSGVEEGRGGRIGTVEAGEEFAEEGSPVAGGATPGGVASPSELGMASAGMERTTRAKSVATPAKRRAMIRVIMNPPGPG